MPMRPELKLLLDFLARAALEEAKRRQRAVTTPAEASGTVLCAGFGILEGRCNKRAPAPRGLCDECSRLAEAASR